MSLNKALGIMLAGGIASGLLWTTGCDDDGGSSGTGGTGGGDAAAGGTGGADSDGGVGGTGGTDTDGGVGGAGGTATDGGTDAGGGAGGTVMATPCPAAMPAMGPGVLDVSAFPARMNAPWSTAVWYAGKDANPPLRNQLAALNLNTTTGQCTATTPFLGPANWFQFTPPAMHDTNVPLPDYIRATDYIGAFDPRDTSNPWTRGWTVGIHGNKAVWDFAGGQGTLGAATAPSANNMCPPGTTRVGTFSGEFGALSRDEERLFTGPAAAGDYDVCELAVRYGTAGTVTLTNDNVYRLPGVVKVGTGDDMNPANDVAVTLVIEPGTLIYGTMGSSLVITRGAKIMAMGTRENPIVMTSEEQIAARFDGNAATDPMGGRQEWGGLVIIGKARDNRCRGNFAACNTSIEGLQDVFGGGNDDADDSGVIQYLIARNGGETPIIDQEINAITFYAVGHRTRAHHLQGHLNSDDGIEFFGSTVSVAYVALTDNADDYFDWGHGYRGAAQHVFIRCSNDFADRAIEADNDRGSPDEVPVSFPLLANFTSIGPTNPNFTSESEKRGGGYLFRRGTKVQLWNSIMQGAATHGVDIDDPNIWVTYNRVMNADNPGGDLVLRNHIFDVPMTRVFAIE